MLTRRRLLELSATACLAAILGHATSARAAGLDPAVADYLRRAPWLPVVGDAVSVAGVRLWLAEVGDLPQLAGRDDAFRLEFTGPAGALPGATHLFRQAALGSFVMFVSPVDTVVGTEQRYEVVVDRSVGVPPVAPTSDSTAAVGAPATTGGPSAPRAAAPAPARPALHRRPRKRRHSTRRDARRRQTRVRAYHG